MFNNKKKKQIGSITLHEELVVHIDDYKIGLIHGHQVSILLI